MNGWHAGPELLARYVTGTLERPAAFSVETHLTACAACRATIAMLVDRQRHERMWTRLVERVDAEPDGLVERLLARLGVPSHISRLLTATRSLRLSWLLAVAAVLAFISAAAYRAPSANGLVWFLVVAPVLPVAGVAAAYGPGIDPSFEIGLTAPMAGLRLLLYRALAVFAATAVLTGAATVALPELGWRAAAWLLPSVGLCAALLALTAELPPRRAAVVVGGGWVVVMLALSWWRTGRAVPAPAMFGAGLQVASVLLALLAVTVVAARRDRFDLPGGRRPPHHARV
jgi:hypothetical protein